AQLGDQIVAVRGVLDADGSVEGHPSSPMRQSGHHLQDAPQYIPPAATFLGLLGGAYDETPAELGKVVTSGTAVTRDDVVRRSVARFRNQVTFASSSLDLAEDPGFVAGLTPSKPFPSAGVAGVLFAGDYEPPREGRAHKRVSELLNSSEDLRQIE